MIHKWSSSFKDVSSLSHKQLINVIAVNILGFVAYSQNFDKELAEKALVEMRKRNIPDVGGQVMSMIDKMLFHFTVVGCSCCAKLNCLKDLFIVYFPSS